jgi:hypothetical protein
MTATMTAPRRAELSGFPKEEEFAWPMLRAVHALGGKAAGRAEIETLAFRYMGLTAGQLAILEPDRSQAEASNRAWWAMTYLSWVNLVRNAEPGRGVWTLMPAARKLFSDHPLMDDVQRAAFVRGAAYGAKRAHEGVEERRIQSRWSA